MQVSEQEQQLLDGMNRAGTLYSLTIIALIFLAILIIMRMFNWSVIDVMHKFLEIISRLVASTINKQEEKYHRDVQIGKITEKNASSKLYRFLSDLIIDLNMSRSGVTPYELLFIVTSLVIVVSAIVCKALFGSFLVSIIFAPIILIGVFCVMYTKANVAHDERIEAVIEAENIICNNIKVGVLVAVRESLDVLPRSVRADFKDFVDNIEQKNYHIKTALLELNVRLGSVADDFIKKCIVFEMEEEHGIAGMFNDVVEMNNIKMEMRIMMKRRFEEVKQQFIMGAMMIFIFLGGVIAIYPQVRSFYLTNTIGHIVIALDVLLIISEFVYITYLRAKEL